MNATLQDQILTNIATEMKNDIDREVMWGMLADTGWTKFSIPRFVDNHHAVDISYWLAEHCQGEYKRNGRHFLFENSKDAMLFMLRWG